MTAADDGDRALTKVSVEALEGAIGDALSEIAGQRFVASIARLDLEPVANAFLLDQYELTIRVRRGSESLIPTSHSLGDSDAADTGGQNCSSSDSVVAERTVAGLTGRQLNQEWQVGARHALYHHEGRWFHQLRQFPGALFDYNGYVLFATSDEFRQCADINITQDVHVPEGIAAMKNYVRRR